MTELKEIKRLTVPGRGLIIVVENNIDRTSTDFKDILKENVTIGGKEYNVQSVEYRIYLLKKGNPLGLVVQEIEKGH